MTTKDSEYRYDSLRKDYVIVAPRRAERPQSSRSPTAALEDPVPCPFCPGNETETTPEILAVRPDGSAANTPGWQIRVVPNKYPALLLDGANAGAGQEHDDRLERGYGSHEVVVETPHHEEDLTDQPLKRLHLTLIVYRERLRALRRDERLHHVQVFKNSGRLAGATMPHPHSQIVATATRPRRFALELETLAEHRRRTSRCLICDTVRQEIAEATRLVSTSRDFVTFCPYASRLPFEMSIAPTQHREDYAECSDQELLILARALRQAIGSLAQVVAAPAFNLVLHTAPPRPCAIGAPVEYHWRFELLPRLVSLAGFEWGTGMYINQLAPEEAARRLREVLPCR